MKICQLLLIILISSCAYDPGDKRLKAVNHTEHEITVYWRSDTIPKYPSINHTEVYLESYSIKPGDNMRLPEYDANWPAFVENSRNKKLNLFVYATDTIRKYKDIDTVNSRKIYKRFEYSQKELDSLDWTIIINK